MQPKKASAILLGLAALLACTTAARAQSFGEPHAKVSIVAEDNGLTPGRTAWLGVLFDLDKGWHTYWINPGDSGEAPKIQWQLPKGFRTGDIRWPVPTRLGTGTVVDYGYEGRVLLALPLEVPADYKQGSPVNLSADVRYLVCSDVCIPAKAHATLTIPGAAGDAASRQLFAVTRTRWPQPMPAAWKVQAKDQGDKLVLSVETGSREAQVAFFPKDENKIDNATKPVVTPTDRGATIAFKKSDTLTTPVTSLSGVVVLASGGAVEITAPVTRGR